MDIIKEKLESFENFMGSVPLVFKTCEMCKNYDSNAGHKEVCKKCCWYYSSSFEIKKC